MFPTGPHDMKLRFQNGEGGGGGEEPAESRNRYDRHKSSLSDALF